MKSMSFRAVIRKKDGVVWEGEANSLSSTNVVGPFDILPKHTHFIGLIEKFVTVQAGQTTKKWQIDRGIISVNNEAVEAYLGY